MILLIHRANTDSGFSASNVWNVNNDGSLNNNTVNNNNVVRPAFLKTKYYCTTVNDEKIRKTSIIPLVCISYKKNYIADGCEFW